MTIEAISAVRGGEWQIGPIDGPAPVGDSTSPGFGGMLSDALNGLQSTQNEAAQASQDLATGKATDPTEVVMSVERAQLAMQLASQIRTKAVEAAQDIFHTQV